MNTTLSLGLSRGHVEHQSCITPSRKSRAGLLQRTSLGRMWILTDEVFKQRATLMRCPTRAPPHGGGGGSSDRTFIFLSTAVYFGSASLEQKEFKRRAFTMPLVRFQRLYIRSFRPQRRRRVRHQGLDCFRYCRSLGLCRLCGLAW